MVLCNKYPCRPLDGLLPEKRNTDLRITKMTLTWLNDLDLIIWPWPLAFQESAKVWTRKGIKSAQGSKRPTTNAVRWNIRTTRKQGWHRICRCCPARTCPAPCPRGQGSRVSCGLPPHARRSGSRLRSLEVDGVRGLTSSASVTSSRGTEDSEDETRRKVWHPDILNRKNGLVHGFRFIEKTSIFWLSRIDLWLNLIL